MNILVSVHFAVVILVLAVKGIVAANTEAAGEEFRIAICSHHGPEIRFPFRVKDRQPEHCGHPGFQVYCHREQTFLEFLYLANTSLHGIQLFLSEEVAVRSINYTSQEIVLDPSQYLTKNLTLVSMSMLSPYAIVPDSFEGRSLYESNTTFLSCPSGVIGESTFVTSLGGQAFPVHYFQDRPSTKHVIRMLEREEFPKMPPNPFRSSNLRPFTNDLEVISEFE